MIIERRGSAIAAALALVAVATLAAATAAVAAAGSPEKGTTFDTGGVSIYYEVIGGGPRTPLIVVNGGPGLEKMELLGHSWGGYLVMAYAARHPDRIAHLMIVDSAAPKIQDTVFLFKNIYPETTTREDGLAFAVELGDEGAISADLREYMSMLFYSAAARDAMLAHTGELSYHQSVNKSVWNDLQRFDLNPELPKFRFPTLVATGRYDFNVAPSVAWSIHRAIPGSEFAVFEKSGHLPYCDESAVFAARLEEFLAKP
jgi:proline iminopeptidase